MGTSTVASILMTIVELIVYVLKKIDSRYADELRRRLDDDPCGVLIDKVGGNKDNSINAHTEKHDESNT